MQFSSVVTNISEKLIVFTFYNEDGGSRFLQNADAHLEGYMAS
jgi:hypothetical protein